MRRVAVAGMAGVWLSVLWSAPVPTPVAAGAATGAAAASEEHRAAVIVDTGTQVKSVCVRFREESISGVEALVRAQVDPVFQAYSGKGAAVCALCGVGCPSGDSCLTCNPEGRFWSYSRAPAGTGVLRTSGVGASSTSVRDGDVEGWNWSLGGTPPFATVEQVCGEAVPATTPTTPRPTTGPAVSTTAAAEAPASSPATTGPTATAAPTPGKTATTAAATITPPAAPVTSAPAGGGADPGPPPPSTPTTGPDATSRPQDRAASRTTAERGGEAGDWPALVGFGVALAGLVGWGARARRAGAARRR